MTPREKFVEAMRLLRAALAYTEFQASGRGYIRAACEAFADEQCQTWRNDETVQCAVLGGHDACRAALLKDVGCICGLPLTGEGDAD